MERVGRHTGRTDIPLTPRGEAAAAALAAALAGRHIPAVFTSPASRAVRTAELAGLQDAKPDPDLQEWDYGGYEGRTTAQIQAERPGWYLWRDGVIPGDAAHPGETVARSARAPTPCWAGSSRCSPRATWRSWRTGTCCGCSPPAGWRSTPDDGRLFRLDTGTFSLLGPSTTSGDQSWNVPPGGQASGEQTPED